MQHNYFKHIFEKHLKKGDVSVQKMADDVGHLKGIVSVQPYDPVTMQKTGESLVCNTVVNSSKTNIIRLISQGSSNWGAFTDPTLLKISRMRFGNALPNNRAISNLLYYDVAEPSMSINGASNPGGSSLAGGTLGNGYEGFGYNISKGMHYTKVSLQGGANSDEGLYAVADESSHIYKLTAWNKYPTASGVYSENVYPPDGQSLIVDLCSADGTIIDSAVFASSYGYSSSGIYPTKLVAGVSALSSAYFAQDGRTTTAGSETSVSTSSTKLLYDATMKRWIVYVALNVAIPSGWYFQTRYTMGKNNVVNDIVPATSFNLGTQYASAYFKNLSEESRFQGAQSYYTINSTPEYQDHASQFIRDYAVTFSCNMSGAKGNGNGASEIQYKQAYLFNGKDELFSAVSLNSSAFNKTNANAYYISWTILAPVS